MINNIIILKQYYNKFISESDDRFGVISSENIIWTESQELP